MIDRKSIQSFFFLRLSSSFSRGFFPLFFSQPPPPHTHTKKKHTHSAPLRSKHFVTVSDAGGASEDLALPGLSGVGRVELAIEESAVKREDGEPELEEVGGTKGSEQIRSRAALFVTDMGSEAVVLVDGEPLAKRQRRRLRPGSVLSFQSLKETKEGGGEEKCEFELFRDEKAHA